MNVNGKKLNKTQTRIFMDMVERFTQRGVNRFTFESASPTTRKSNDGFGNRERQAAEKLVEMGIAKLLERGAYPRAYGYGRDSKVVGFYTVELLVTGCNI